MRYVRVETGLKRQPIIQISCAACVLFLCARQQAGGQAGPHNISSADIKHRRTTNERTNGELSVRRPLLASIVKRRDVRPGDDARRRLVENWVGSGGGRLGRVELTAARHSMSVCQTARPAGRARRRGGGEARLPGALPLPHGARRPSVDNRQSSRAAALPPPRLLSLAEAAAAAAAAGGGRSVAAG